MVTQHYRWDFIGLSTDNKPTAETSAKVTDGSTFYCSDNSKLYVWYKDQWYEKEDTGGGGELPIASADTLGGIKVGTGLSINSESGVLSADGVITELTSADYDYHRTGSVDDGVALWRLQPGWYIAKAGTKVYAHTALYGSATATGDCPITIYSLDDSKKNILFAGNQGLLKYYGVTSSGDFMTYTPGRETLLSSTEIVDNLTSTEVWAPLSANQGYVLKGLIDDLDARLTAGGL